MEAKPHFWVGGEFSYSLPGLSAYPETSLKTPEASKKTSLDSSNRIIQTRKKKRSFWFYYANSEIKKIIDFNNEIDLSNVIYSFEQWIENYKSCYVHLSKENTHVFIKCINRFTKQYKKKLQKRLKKLDDIKWDLKIELTIDPNKFMKLFDEYIYITKAFNKLRSYLLKKYGHFDFLRVLEVTKKGRPHLHILISGIRWIPHKELSALWEKYGCGKIVCIKRIKERNNIRTCRYVLKYVEKTLNMNVNECKIFSSLLFATNKRLFGLSRRLQNIISKKTTKIRLGFIYENVVYESDLKTYVIYKNLIMKDYIIIEATAQDYYEFPFLFSIDV